VIDVSVRFNTTELMRRGVDGQRLPIPQPELLETLEEPAVDEIGGVAVVKEIL